MGLISKNIAANLVGSAWTAALGLALLPVYIRLMGVEAYGLVGFFLLLQSVLNLLDLGISPTVNREAARSGARPGEIQETWDLIRTLEFGYWGLAALIGGALVALAPFIAGSWVKPQGLSPDTVTQALVMVGILSALQWPISFYTNGIMGLQKQVPLNVVNSAMTTVRGLGAILALHLIGPTIIVFFTWQAVAMGLHTGALALLFWQSAPHTPDRPRFRASLLLQVWKFATGMSGTTILAVILTQLDKVILSKILSLEMFGYYSIAGIVANSMYMLITPVYSATFPKYSRLVAIGDIAKLKTLYHLSCQAVSVLVLPVATILALFAPEILQLWTGNPTTAANAQPLVRLLVVGTAMNAMLNQPFAVTLANGWTSIGLKANAVAVLILVPLTAVLASTYGAVGGAIVWPILNTGYLILVEPIIHRRLLAGELQRWYLEDVAVPLAASASIGLLGRLLISGTYSQPVLLLSIAAVSAATLAGATIAAPLIRTRLVATANGMLEAHGH